MLQINVLEIDELLCDVQLPSSKSNPNKKKKEIDPSSLSWWPLIMGNCWRRTQEEEWKQPKQMKKERHE